MIKPTVGRVVLVYRYGANRAEPALICRVWSDNCINVGGFDENGQHFSCSSLELVHEEPYPDSSHARWMPYQMGQAARTEAAEAKLANGV